MLLVAPTGVLRSFGTGDGGTAASSLELQPTAPTLAA